MEEQSNALTRLDVVLTEAVDSGNREQAAGPILLQAMGLENQPENIVAFYELLNKANEEANSIRRVPRLDRYIGKLSELRTLFVVSHVWGAKWNTFAANIENKGLLVAVGALSNFYSVEEPYLFLEEDFLLQLQKEFHDILQDIIKSNLSNDLKRVLIERIEEILKAINRYKIDGTKGLEIATRLFLSDCVTNDILIQEEDKQNPIYKRVKAFILSLAIYLTPTPYDVIGAVTDIQGYWKPEFEELAHNSVDIEKILSGSETIQEAFSKAFDLLKGSKQKVLSGRDEPKALPPSQDSSETE